MEQLLMSAEQLSSSMTDMSCTNPALSSYSVEDVNGNQGGDTNTAEGRERLFTTTSASTPDAVDKRPTFPLPVRLGGARGGAADGWCTNLNPPGGRRPVASDVPPAPPLPPLFKRGLKRQQGETSGTGSDHMITFSPPDTPLTFTAPRQPEGAARTDMADADFRPPATSLVLTAASPTPSAANPIISTALAGRGRHCRQLVPHQSAGEPFWFPSPGALRTIHSIQCNPGGSGTRSSMESGTGNDTRFVSDLRSIASGALVDIEIPSSYAGSCVSITGSQTTLLSTASPYKRGSVRRSFSADSLFSAGGKGSALGECPAPLVVLPGSNRTPTMEDALPLTMKRTTSLDQLRMLSPYPMPPLSCFVSPKTAAMVRSLSLEERASLALSMDEPICRICWQGGEAEECIQPCYCSTHVHQSCVQRWLGVAKITYCEVCRYQYKAIRKMKPLAQWRWWPNKNRHLAQLEATIILLGVVTPPLLCGIILCSQKIAEYLKTPDNAWKTAGLMTLVMVSVGTYLGALLYFCHKFTTVCKIWANSNRTTVVTVVPLTPAQRRPKLDPCRVWSIS